MSLMTLAQLAALKGVDSTATLFDLTGGQFPEINVIPGRPVPGTSYNVPIRKTLPTGGFRKANSDGVTLTSSTYDFLPTQCYIFDVQLQVDKAVAMAHPFGYAAFLADEQEAAFRGSVATLMEQVYYGVAAGSDGFNGFASFLTDSDGTAFERLTIDAGGESPADDLTSAFVVRVGSNNGVSWAFGNNGEFLASEAWAEAQAVLNSKAKTVVTNGTTTWLGLQYYPTSVVRIANVPIQELATDLLSDHVIARAIKRFPAAYPPTHIFMNRDARYSLRLSRSLGATGIAGTVGGAQLAPEPTESNGLPIVVTDGIRSDEDEVS